MARVGIMIEAQEGLTWDRWRRLAETAEALGFDSLWTQEQHAAPYLMWLPALVWIGPPILWAAFEWAWAAVTTAISLVIWMAVYRAEGAPLDEAGHVEHDLLGGRRLLGSVVPEGRGCHA